MSSGKTFLLVVAFVSVCFVVGFVVSTHGDDNEEPLYRFCDGKVERVDVRDSRQLVACPDGSLRLIR